VDFSTFYILLPETSDKNRCNENMYCIGDNTGPSDKRVSAGIVVDGRNGWVCGDIPASNSQSAVSIPLGQLLNVISQGWPQFPENCGHCSRQVPA